MANSSITSSRTASGVTPPSGSENGPPTRGPIQCTRKSTRTHSMGTRSLCTATTLLSPRAASSKRPN
eukprot:2432153-Pyramimonas_sp.AAC.1